jgi:hypothetical protein
MRSILEWLLGLDLSGAEGAEWFVEWSNGPTGGDAWLWTVVLLGGIVSAVAWLYRKDAVELAKGARRLLTVMRVFVAVGLLVILLEPVLVIERTEHVPTNLLVLRDTSASMALNDRYPETPRNAQLAAKLGFANVSELSRATRAQTVAAALEQGLLADLKADGDRRVRLHDFADHLFVDPLPDGAPGRPSDGAFTAIGASIEQALAAYQGPPLAGVLLISDGRSNAGPDPLRSAELLLAARVPLHVLAAGTEARARNLKILRLEAGPIAMVRDPFEVRVHLEARGLVGETAEVVLERAVGGEWREIGTRQVDLLEGGALAEARFRMQEDTEQDLQLRARVADMGGETSVEDNVASAAVRIVRQELKTLLIGGLAFPEVQFLINTLMRDETVELASWLQGADAEYVQKGNQRLSTLPNTQDQLDEYDCVVLYDPDFSELPIGFGRMLAEFVGKQAGGLVYIAGETNTKELFDRKFADADAVLALLPVYREPGLHYSRIEERKIAESEWRMEITTHGVDSEFFQFADDPEANARVLRSLPGMYWHFPVTRAKPGATVLARHGDPRMRNQYGGHVVCATQLFGPGRSTFLALDSTFRWRYLDEELFDGFWARLVGYSGRAKLLGGRSPLVVDSDRTRYAPGSVATLRARFRNADQQRAALQMLHAQVEVGDEQPEVVALVPDPEDPTLFSARFQVQRSGEHLLRVWPSDTVQEGAEGTAYRFMVEFPDREIAEPAQDRATLTALATAAGGRVFDLVDHDQIGAAFATRRLARTEQDRQELWDAPLLFGAVLLVLFIEWVLRKRHQLV